MDRISRHIASKLIDLLPEDEEYYKLEELLELGFPRFVVQRIQVELERNLAETTVPPQTDWANMKSEAVQHAWNQFINAIRAESRLPASYAHSIVETAIADIMEILVQPRKNIPEVIFGASNELRFEEIERRMDLIVVYRHFAKLLPRYMQRKDLDKLAKEQCAEIVRKADQKLVEHYSPLNWAQMLEPLFSLLDEQIDSNLLRLFFEDKKMPRISRQFDMMNRSLNRAQLIEVLSSPDLLNLDGDEVQQNELFDEGDDTAIDSEKTDEKSSRDEKKQAAEAAGEASDQEEADPVVDSFHSSREKKEAKPEKSDDESPLNETFTEEVEEEESDSGDDSDSSLNEAFKEEGADEREEKEVKQKKDRDEEEGEERSSPIWQRFVSAEELEEYEKQLEEENMDEDGFIEEPIIDLTKNEEPDESHMKRLEELLEDERDRFVEEIFRGSDEAYDEAVAEICMKESWSDASKYIEKEVFQRNLVDMYSEAAVDFTDRLQTFFIELTKSK